MTYKPLTCYVVNYRWLQALVTNCYQAEGVDNLSRSMASSFYSSLCTFWSNSWTFENWFLEKLHKNLIFSDFSLWKTLRENNYGESLSGANPGSWVRSCKICQKTLIRPFWLLRTAVMVARPFARIQAIIATFTLTLRKKDSQRPVIIFIQITIQIRWKMMSAFSNSIQTWGWSCKWASMLILHV